MLTKHGTAVCQNCGLETALKSQIAGAIRVVLEVHFTDAGVRCDGSNTNHWS